MAAFDEFVLCCTPTTRNNRKITIPTRKTPRKNHFRFAFAILENGGFRQIRLPGGPGSPIRSRNYDGDAKIAFSFSKHLKHDVTSKSHFRVT